MIRAAIVFFCLSLPAMAQEATIISPIDGAAAIVPDAREDEVQAKAADGVRLKGLDKVSGDVSDLDLNVGETASVGRIEVTLGECRYPTGNPAGDAFAYLVIDDAMAEAPVFEGWMIASSPALNPLDHARYDIWVLRCKTE